MGESLYKNPKKDIYKRVKDLLNRMNIDEKISQLTSIWLNFDPEKDDVTPTFFGDDINQRTKIIDLNYFFRIINQIIFYRPFNSAGKNTFIKQDKH